MPVKDFSGECFVAYTDISGFKELMKRDKLAVHAIDRLYTSGYNALRDNSIVNGFFISDCGILFTRTADPIQQLQSLLKVLKEINRNLLENELMLTTSIAWGQFSYHNRIEFPGINKQPIYGNAYVSAFLDNETGSPKLDPGQCRIKFNGLPDAVRDHLSNNPLIECQKNHFYYYWMVKNPADIAKFKQRYSDSYKLKFSGMLAALQDPAG